MKIEPQITFEGFNDPGSKEAARTLILREAERLEMRMPRVTGCRVSVTVPSNRHHQGGNFQVHIWLTVPPHENVVVNHEAADDPRYERADTAIKEAFAAARRQLDDLARSN